MADAAKTVSELRPRRRRLRRRRRGKSRRWTCCRAPSLDSVASGKTVHVPCRWCGRAIQRCAASSCVTGTRWDRARCAAALIAKRMQSSLTVSLTEAMVEKRASLPSNSRRGYDGREKGSPTGHGSERIHWTVRFSERRGASEPSKITTSQRAAGTGGRLEVSAKGAREVASGTEERGEGQEGEQG